MKTIILSGLSLLAALGALHPANLHAASEWDIDDEKLSLPAPPKKGSAAYQEDFRILFKYQEERSEKDCAVSKRLGRWPTMSVFFGAQQKLLSAEEFARVEKFGNSLIKAVVAESKPFKDLYQRVRPYDANEEIEPCTYIPGGKTSYPSSHAAAGWLLGKVLGLIYPGKSEALLDAGFKIGELRVLGGVHHPSDVMAGRALADQVFKELLKKPPFVKTIQKLKKK